MERVDKEEEQRHKAGKGFAHPCRHVKYCQGPRFPTEASHAIKSLLFYSPRRIPNTSLSVSLLAENLCFWQACEDVRHGESSKIIEKVEEIYK